MDTRKKRPMDLGPMLAVCPGHSLGKILIKNRVKVEIAVAYMVCEVTMM